MGNKTLVYKQKVNDNLNESNRHLDRLKGAFSELKKEFVFPIENDSFNDIIENIQSLAYCDQIIYRFSKLQDCIGAKLFKSLLMYQGEDTNKPFLDILNRLEKMKIIDVDDWFELRDLRNEIAHDYAGNDDLLINILNMIYKNINEINNILNRIKELV